MAERGRRPERAGCAWRTRQKAQATDRRETASRGRTPVAGEPGQAAGQPRDQAVSPDVAPPRDEAAVSRFVERFAAVLVEAGIPRMPARVFAALLAADSGRLTAAELSEQLQASPAAVSGGVRYLIGVGMVSREGEPGSRRHHYRVPDHVWDEVVSGRDRVLARWTTVLREGMALLGRGHAGGREAGRFSTVLRVCRCRAAARARQVAGAQGRARPGRGRHGRRGRLRPGTASQALDARASPVSARPGFAGRMDEPRQNVGKTGSDAMAEEAAAVPRDPGDLYQVSPDAPEPGRGPRDALLPRRIRRRGRRRTSAGHASALDARPHRDRQVRRRLADRLPLPPAFDDLHQGPLGERRRARDHRASAPRRRWTRHSCCSTASSRTGTGRRSPRRCSS